MKISESCLVKGALRLRLFALMGLMIGLSFFEFRMVFAGEFGELDPNGVEERPSLGEELLSFRATANDTPLVEIRKLSIAEVFAFVNDRDGSVRSISLLEHGQGEAIERLGQEAQDVQNAVSGRETVTVQKFRFGERARAYFRDPVKRANTSWILVRWAATGTATGASVAHWHLIGTVESAFWAGVAVAVIGAGTGAMSAAFQFLNDTLNRFSSTHYVTGSRRFQEHFPNWVGSRYHHPRAGSALRQEFVNLVEQFGKWSILDLVYLTVHEILKVGTVATLGRIDVGAHVAEAGPIVLMAAFKEVFIQAGFDSAEHASSARKIREAYRRGDGAAVQRLRRLNQSKIVLISAITTGLAALDIVFRGQNPILNGTFVVAGSLGWMWYLRERLRKTWNPARSIDSIASPCADAFSKRLKVQEGDLAPSGGWG